MIYSQKVDFHSHFLSPTYYEYLKKYEDEKPDSFPTPSWSIESHINLMDRLGVAVSLLSISSPNLSRAPREEEVRMVHQINIEGKAYVDEYPERLGMFASLPLPHVDEAIDEAVFALDELHCDGIGLCTNYAGVYLGDERYDPLMSLLDERGTVVFIHPTKPASLPAGVNEDVPIPAMEFLMDTTRTFVAMFMRDIFGKYPNIRWVFPHAGAFLSILSDRINGFAILMKQDHPELPMDFRGDMKHIYFDVAGFPLQKQLEALLKDVEVGNLVYGSDTPYTPDIACTALSGGLDELVFLSDEEKFMVFTANAASLFPRLSELLGVEADEHGICYADRPLTGKERRSRRIRSLVAKAYGRIFR